MALAPVGTPSSRERLAPSRLAGLVRAMWFYAVASWRREPHVPPGYRAFSSHKQSGYTTVVAVMLALVAVETFAVHLLVARFSTVAACALTALSAYAMLWMVAETRAVALNPLLVNEEELIARWGMLVCEHVPLNLIARVSEVEPSVPKGERLNLAAMGARACWIELTEPLETRGITGKPRLVRALEVSPDDIVAFRNALLPRS